MVPVEGPSVPGAMMTPSGEFAVPSIDHQAYLEGKKPSLPAEEMAEKPSIPEDLMCSICHDLLTDTVMIPCCGSSFCDECIRTVLLESENHQCPDCKEIGISPDTMIPNRYLRKSVDNFRNTTGYQRTMPSRTPLVNPPPGNSLVQVPLVQPIQPIIQQQPILTVGAKPSRPLEVINLVESRSDTDSPVQVDNHKSHSKHRFPLLQTPVPSTNPVVLPSKGVEMSRGPPQDSARMQYSQPDRSATPTIDERTVSSSLPDTSVPPPLNTYPITTFTSNPQPAYGGPPPGYGVPPPAPYPRAPLPYPNMGPGPGPAPAYSHVEPRGRDNMRSSYRPYSRGGRGRHGYDRPTNSSQMGRPLEEDPVVQFESLMREKELRRRRKRSFSRSPSPRPRSRTPLRSPVSHRKRNSVSLSPPARQRSRTRSRSPPSPPPRARSRSPSPPPRRSPRKPRSRTPLRSPPPVKRRSPSFTISRSRSRSFSRTPSPRERERHFSPRRRDETRFRSPLQSRVSPPRYHGRNYKEYEGQYYEGQRGPRGRPRGYHRGGRGGDTNFYTNSPSRYDNRYEDRSNRGYQPPQHQPPARQDAPNQAGRYNARRYDNYVDPVPPGTEPIVSYDRYPSDFTDHVRVVTLPPETRDRDGKRERDVRDAVARDWERTRDRELEQREKERMKEYEEYHRSSHPKSSSPEKYKKKSNERSYEREKENKHHSGETIPAFSMRKQVNEPYVDTSRNRIPVLVDLKREPSVEKEEKKELLGPIKEKDREKKKDKDKKKKRREEGEKKEKKKKRKEKKEEIMKGKSEEKVIPVKTSEGKPIVVAFKGESANVDPLYGDIEGAKVDKDLVENYGKVDQKQVEGVSGEIVATPAEPKENVMLAPVPELSKWELDEDLPSLEERLIGDDISNSTDKKVVTSEVLKRAENAIFQKAINALRPSDVGKKVVEVIPDKEKRDRKETKEVTVKDQEVSEEPIEISPDPTVESREARKVANSIQITIPSNQTKAPERSVEIAKTSLTESSDHPKNRSRSERSKTVASVPVVPTSPVRVSAKERLGAKVETDREEGRRVRSSVNIDRRSRSRSPRRFFDRKHSERDKQRDISPGGRRVIVSSSWARDKDKDDNRKERKVSESNKSLERRVEKGYDKERDRRRDRRSKSSSRERRIKKEAHSEKIVVRKRDDKPEERKVTVKIEQKKEVDEKKVRKNPRLSTDKRKTAIDEASFEPDYDETEPESEPEVPGEEKNLLVNVTVNPSPSKKRSRSPSENKEKKKLKSEITREKSVDQVKGKELEKVKKSEPAPEETSESESSSDSSSDSSVDRKKHRKKKKTKKRKKKKMRKRKNSSSDSDSSVSSSSDSDVVKKKKKHKHKKKSSKSKKRKKSKHK